MTINIEKVAVIGAGAMCHGIAQLSATNGYEVSLIDIEEDILEDAMEEIEWSLNKFVEKNKITEGERDDTLDRLETTTDQDEGVSDADLVIEAAPEKMDLKKQIFSDADDASPDDAIIASNTSSLSIGEMATAIEKPERFIGIHFFNPPVRMPLVEIIRHEGTSDEVVDASEEYAENLDKTVVICRKDVRGFIVNRILAPVINEAGWALHREEATKEEIDAAAKFKAGLPMGLFELADFTGLDIMREVGKVLHDAYGDRMEPSPVVDDIVEEGNLGKKSGEGFYDSWPDRPSISLMQAEEFDYKRIYAVAANEAAFIIYDDVADPEDIDTAIEMGLGWGEGPCKLADDEGLDDIVALLEELYDEHGDERYDPCPLLKEYVDEGRGFYG